MEILWTEVHFIETVGPTRCLWEPDVSDVSQLFATERTFDVFFFSGTATETLLRRDSEAERLLMDINQSSPCSEYI